MNRKRFGFFGRWSMAVVLPQPVDTQSPGLCAMQNASTSSQKRVGKSEIALFRMKLPQIPMMTAKDMGRI